VSPVPSTFVSSYKMRRIFDTCATLPGRWVRATNGRDAWSFLEGASDVQPHASVSNVDTEVSITVFPSGMVNMSAAEIPSACGRCQGCDLSKRHGQVACFNTSELDQAHLDDFLSAHQLSRIPLSRSSRLIVEWSSSCLPHDPGGGILSCVM
jgi:hypothetical protein